MPGLQKQLGTLFPGLGKVLHDLQTNATRSGQNTTSGRNAAFSPCSLPLRQSACSTEQEEIVNSMLAN